MKVLMVESYPGIGWHAARQLGEAGHTVLFCATREAGVFCRGLDGTSSCPLDEDVAVAVLARTPGDIQPGEHGALCAARQRLPLVTTSEHVEAGPFSALTSPAGDDLVAACERAAASGERHARAVERDLVQLGTVRQEELTGDDPAVAVEVHREPRRLAMRLRLPDDETRAAAIVKSATEALRRYDHHTPVIDVSRAG